MASRSQGLRIAIQIVLGIVIVVLAYFLYLSITEPYAEIERQEQLTELTRQRMDNIRQAMIRYEVVNERYPSTLDSLVMFIREDSLFSLRADSIFGESVNVDSLPFSPRTGKRFELTVSDTAQVAAYLLEDPDSDDQIGTLAADVTEINAASWE